MAINPKWNETYSPAEMTRSSWVPLDMSTVTEYPSSGRGKGAQLGYIVGMDSGSPGASATNPSYVTIVDNNGDEATVSNNGFLNVRIAESVTVLSAFEVDATGVSGLNIRAEVEYPDTAIYKPFTTTQSVLVSTIDFGRNVQSFEVYNNNQNNNVYLSFNVLPITTLSAQGLPLTPESYYSINMEKQTITVGSTVSGVDIRVIGTYRNA